MKATITPSVIRGSVTAPASKSAMQRACAAALIRHGETRLRNYGVSNDDKAALGIIEALGATVTYEDGNVLIHSHGIDPKQKELNCGESGLSIRMFTSIAAISDQPVTITGSGSLVKRPQDFFTDVLPRLGVSVSSNGGFLPLTIQGPLVPKDITVDGSLSSQFLTGLLFAYSALKAKDVTLTVENLNSKPYIDLTCKVLADFGLAVPENVNYTAFKFSAEKEIVAGHGTLEYEVEGDWSGGAFLLVAGAVAGNITVHGLDLSSTQADRAILQALIQSGAGMSIEDKQIGMRAGKLRAFQFNATDCPDLFPPLVSLAAYCEGTSVIEGVNRLTHKESNRALTLQEEFGKLGVRITLQDDLMIIEGGNSIKGATVYSHHDHRIAMACAVAGLNATGPVVVGSAEAVNKSYPQFWEHLQLLKAQLSLDHN